MYYVDYHIHSMFSDDSNTTLEDIVKNAISKGIKEICITDHVDYGVKTDMNCPYFFYKREFLRIQKIYKKDITMKFGIEFGLQTEYIHLFQKDFDKYDFDFIIMSNHQVGNKEFWTYEFQEGKTQKEYHTQYYQAILNCVNNYKDYSVLGHLDMIKRYDKNGSYDDENVKNIICQILKQVIKDGKGIEINTSSHQYKLNDTMPSTNILKWYKELGGTIITIGSDAHDTSRIGSHFDTSIIKLKEIGFNEIYTFEKMKPIAHKI